jgi:hypothetical protein
MVFLLPTSYAGSGLFSYFLTILGDFSWPFMTILAWPLTLGAILVCFLLLTAMVGGGSVEISYMFHNPPTAPEYKVYE